MLSVLSLPLGLLAFLSVFVSNAFGIPTLASSYSSGFSMNLMRRSSRSSALRTPEEWGLWAKKHHDMLIAKYGLNNNSTLRRGEGTNLMINQQFDSSFYGTLAIGTPAVSYNVVLDTGSADLWVASSACQVGCQGIATFNSQKSSSFSTTNTPFSISYGSGDASGILGTDVVQMAGFSVSNQVFAICDVVNDVLESPVSGLLGLAFQSIAASGATPFWETLVQKGAWDSPVMSFQMTRYIDDEEANSLEPGGTFTMGFVNSSLFTGNIDYNDIPADSVGFWMQTLTSVTSQGTSITLGSGASSLAAIDTGTTGVAGPQQYISEIYAQIPGSTAGTGNYQNYFMYPCSTTVNITMAFGGQSWSISNADFQLIQVDKNTCVGAFFYLSTESSTPSWIVGDTFLKNVYSVFRYNPPSVGFAVLSEYALSLNDNNNIALPTPTIGAIVAEVSESSSGPSVLKYRPAALAIMVTLLGYLLS